MTRLARQVLNKADQVDAQKLIRIYGALMWSLGKVIKTPECVYTRLHPTLNPTQRL